MTTTFTLEEFIRLAPLGLVVRCDDRILYPSKTLPVDTTTSELLQYSNDFLRQYMSSEASHHYVVRYDDEDTHSTMYDSWNIFIREVPVRIVTKPTTALYRRTK